MALALPITGRNIVMRTGKKNSVNVIYKRVLSYFCNMRIAWKFTWAYFMILALPIIGTGIFINYSTTKSFIDQSEILAKQSLLQKRELIQQKIESVEKTAVSITQNPQILKYLEDPFQNNRQGYENYIYSFAPIFESYIIQNKFVYSTMLYTSNTSFPDSWNNIYHLDNIEANQQYRTFLKDDSALGKWNPIHDTKMAIYARYKMKEKVLSYSHKLISFTDKKCIGVLEVEITEKELFGDLEAGTGITEYYLVIDKNQNIISENTYKVLPEELKTFDFLSVLANSQEQDGIIEYKNEQLIVQYIPLEPIECSLIGIVPLANYMGDSPDSGLIITVVIIIALIVFGIIIHLVSNQLTKRLKDLVNGLKSVRNDNINIKMPVKYNDEFGELAVSFNRMTDRIHELIESVYKAQIMEKESELKALESQINPHFLYNTLSTISWMARKVDAKNIDDLTFQLSRFYRLVLSKGNSIITVNDEIELLKSYVEIEKTRFDDQFQVEFDLDEKAYQYKMIKIILQPIAENAIIHGIAPKDSMGTLVVRLRQDEHYLYFSIIDDGVGIARNVLDSIKKGEITKKRESGYAIQNVIERIKAVYGDQGHISIFSRPGIGCSVRIVIPKTIKFPNL